ncbi:MAG: pirin family protein [Dechloromonas sp.]|nr:pirin family protein [Dechloromonas sp.]
MLRAIAVTYQAELVIDDGDMLLRRALPLEQMEALGPFVFIDHYRHHSKRGIGDKPHPHAGIEVLSYLLEGGVEHRDSLGFRDRLGAGDAQFIRAGRGILHAEQPLGGRHGLQLWTTLPPSLKLTEPSYASFRAANIPEVEHPGASVRIIAGQVDGCEGPMKLASPTTLAHIHLEAATAIALAVDDAQELGLYVLDGSLATTDGAELGPGTLIVLTQGDQVSITAAHHGPVDVALVGGMRVEGTLLFSGPFVMDTPERLAQTRRDFISGKMGTLDGVPF